LAIAIFVQLYRHQVIRFDLAVQPSALTDLAWKRHKKRLFGHFTEFFSHYGKAAIDKNAWRVRHFGKQAIAKNACLYHRVKNRL
jgi:hypothetical protein